MIVTRWMSFCEYAKLEYYYVINERTAPFAVISERDDMSDCSSPVPIGSLMVWPENEEGYTGQAFGSVRVKFRIDEGEIVWRGTGTYRQWREQYDCTLPKVMDEWTHRELAVMELRMSQVVSVMIHSKPQDDRYMIELYGMTRICSREDPHIECLELARKLPEESIYSLYDPWEVDLVRGEQL